MAYTLTQASKACGKSKATLLRAIRSSRLSAARDDVAGSWLIEASELHRVFAPGSTVPGTGASDDAPVPLSVPTVPSRSRRGSPRCKRRRDCVTT
jgi:hypothetical protein